MFTKRKVMPKVNQYIKHTILYLVSKGWTAGYTSSHRCMKWSCPVNLSTNFWPQSKSVLRLWTKNHYHSWIEEHCRSQNAEWSRNYCRTTTTKALKQGSGREPYVRQSVTMSWTFSKEQLTVQFMTYTWFNMQVNNNNFRLNSWK